QFKPRFARNQPIRTSLPASLRAQNADHPALQTRGLHVRGQQHARGRRRSCPAVRETRTMPGTGPPSRITERRGRRPFRYHRARTERLINANVTGYSNRPGWQGLHARAMVGVQQLVASLLALEWPLRGQVPVKSRELALTNRSRSIVPLAPRNIAALDRGAATAPDSRSEPARSLRFANAPVQKPRGTFANPSLRSRPDSIGRQATAADCATCTAPRSIKKPPR